MTPFGVNTQQVLGHAAELGAGLGVTLSHGAQVSTLSRPMWGQPGSQAEGSCPAPGPGQVQSEAGLRGDGMGPAQAAPWPGGSSCVSAQVRVRELEEQCRSQTERFSLLARELQAFRLHPGPLDLLTSALGCGAPGDRPPPPCCCSTPQPCRGSGPKGEVDPQRHQRGAFVLSGVQGQRRLAAHPKSHSKLEPVLA